MSSMINGIKNQKVSTKGTAADMGPFWPMGRVALIINYVSVTETTPVFTTDRL